MDISITFSCSPAWGLIELLVNVACRQHIRETITFLNLVLTTSYLKFICGNRSYLCVSVTSYLDSALAQVSDPGNPGSNILPLN